MAYDDSKFTDHKAIMASLASVLKGKHIDEADCIEWCQTCVINYIKDADALWLYEGVGLTVENYRAQIPCNVVRILDIYSSASDKDSTVYVKNTGAYLHLPSTYTSDTIYINFYGTPIDTESGIPLILKSHEEACKAFIVRNAFYEDFLNGKIDASRWSYVESDMSNKVRAAKTQFARFRTRQDMDKTHIIRGNMISRIGDQSLTHLEWNK